MEDKDKDQPKNLEQLLEKLLEAAEEEEKVSVKSLFEAVGRRSFGPVLLLTGIVALAPVIGDIPGMPTLIGLVVLLVTVQLLFGKSHFWLPQWLLKREVSSSKLKKSIGWMKKPAKFIDRLIRPRLQWFVKGASVKVIAATSAAIALAMPMMEIVPLTANVAGAALAAFGLALIAGDGLLALIALVLSVSTIGLAVANIL